MTYLKLLLIRHAESFGNCKGKMEGQTSTALSPRGRRQAQCLTQRLTKALKAGKVAAPTHLYTSPLQRALETAAYLQADAQIPDYQIAPELQELNQGIFQGLTWPQALSQYPDICQQLIESSQWLPVPQAESLTDARQRAQRWLAHLLKTHDSPDVIWAVSHGGLMQQLVSAILGCDRTWKIPIHHTAIFEFWLARNYWSTLQQDRYNPEWWVLKRFNDHAHLSKVMD